MCYEKRENVFGLPALQGVGKLYGKMPSLLLFRDENARTVFGIVLANKKNLREILQHDGKKIENETFSGQYPAASFKGKKKK